MKYVQTIWRMSSSQSAADRESCLGSLVAEIETSFPSSRSFVVSPEYCQRVMVWLETRAAGPYSIEVLPDGGVAVAVGTRQDAVRLRAIPPHCIDQSVVVANRSAEQIRGFFGQLKGRRAS